MCVRSPGLPVVVGLTGIAGHPLRDGSLLAYRLRRLRCLVWSVYIAGSSVSGLSCHRAAARPALRFIVGRCLLARLRLDLRDPVSIISSCGDGLGARAAMKKNGGWVFSFPVPLLAWLLFFSDSELLVHRARFYSRPGWSLESRSHRLRSCRTGRE